MEIGVDDVARTLGMRLQREQIEFEDVVDEGHGAERCNS